MSAKRSDRTKNRRGKGALKPSGTVGPEDDVGASGFANVSVVSDARTVAYFWNGLRHRRGDDVGLGTVARNVERGKVGTNAMVGEEKS